MDRLTLTHLTFVGTNVPIAVIEFGPNVTVVRGPSDTGKSFIVNAIDFVLGAKKLKEIPERSGYSTVLLGLELPDGEQVTLSRSVTGGGIGLYRADLRSAPTTVPDEKLAHQHKETSTPNKNLSRFLLNQIQLDGKRVRKNLQNVTNSLSFRDLAHLCIIDETSMQSDIAPPLKGTVTTKTKELSVLKLLLEDEDDSSLVQGESSKDKNKLKGAKLQIIEQLVTQIESQLEGVAAPTSLREQLDRLNHTIDDQGYAIGELARTQTDVLDRKQAADETSLNHQMELGDARALKQRFGLLRQQYDSDLARLDMIREAGNLLGYFRRGTCVFCGAPEEHQHLNMDCEGDTNSFGESVEREIQKTQYLRSDLQETIDRLAARTSELREQSNAALQESQRLQRQIAELDESMRPHQIEFRELLNTRSEVERHIALHEQLESLEKMKLQVGDDSDTETASMATGVGLAPVREFSTEISKRLAEWGFPEADKVRYSRKEQDIVAGDQLRSAHGKGVRAILHAAFTLGLAQYCFDRDLPHPGFVVLDSPLVTYRPPDENGNESDSPPKDVAAAFYRDVQHSFDGQVIILENTDPPEPLNQETVDVRFTKLSDHGRYGFFPYQTLQETIGS